MYYTMLKNMIYQKQIVLESDLIGLVRDATREQVDLFDLYIDLQRLFREGIVQSTCGVLVYTAKDNKTQTI